jgi:hypothetical protein
MIEAIVADVSQAPLKRVLVIRIGRLGDTILATPVIEAIRSSLGTDVQIDFARFVHYREFCRRPLIEPAHLSDRHCVDTEKSIYAPVLGVEVTVAA